MFTVQRYRRVDIIASYLVTREIFFVVVIVVSSCVCVCVCVIQLGRRTKTEEFLRSRQSTRIIILARQRVQLIAGQSAETDRWRQKYLWWRRVDGTADYGGSPQKPVDGGTSNYEDDAALPIATTLPSWQLVGTACRTAQPANGTRR